MAQSNCVSHRASAHPASPPSPGRDIRPRPDVAQGEPGDRLREIGVPAAPVVYDARALYAKTGRDFAGAHEILDVNLAAHASDARQRSIAWWCLR